MNDLDITYPLRAPLSERIDLTDRSGIVNAVPGERTYFQQALKNRDALLFRLDVFDINGAPTLTELLLARIWLVNTDGDIVVDGMPLSRLSPHKFPYVGRAKFTPVFEPFQWDPLRSWTVGNGQILTPVPFTAYLIPRK